MSPSNPPKQINFAPSARIYLVPMLSEFATEEIEQLWMNDDEEEASRGAVVSDVVVMRRLYKKGYTTNEILSGSESESTDDYDATCFRGIEHMVTSDASRQRKVGRKRAIRAVLIEQERQHQMGEDDPTLIASASLHATAYARDRAVEFASRDLRYVINHVLPTMRTKRDTFKQSLSSSSSSSSFSSSSTRTRKPRRTPSSPPDTEHLPPDMYYSNHSDANQRRPNKTNGMLQKNLTALEMEFTSRLSFGEHVPPSPPSSIRKNQKAAKTA